MDTNLKVLLEHLGRIRVAGKAQWQSTEALGSILNTARKEKKSQP
jgi:hypothetical protein